MIVSTYFLSPNTHWKIASTTHVLWLRELTKDGHWRNLQNSFENTKNYSLLESLNTMIQKQLRSYRDISRRQECRQKCHLYSKKPFSLRNDIMTLPPSPSPFNSEIIEDLSHQNQIQSYDTGIEESSCSPNIVIAGFAQSAVSIIYSLLLSHPQTLPLLGSGQSYLENQKTSCYRTDVDSRYFLYTSIKI